MEERFEYHWVAGEPIAVTVELVFGQTHYPGDVVQRGERIVPRPLLNPEQEALRRRLLSKQAERRRKSGANQRGVQVH